MKLFDRFFGNTAKSRNEALIADKLAEIAGVEKAQAKDRLTIQERIDGIDNKVAALRKERKRIETEMETADRLNAVQLKKLQTELAELWTQKETLDRPTDIEAPAGKTLTIRTGETDSRKTQPY